VATDCCIDSFLTANNSGTKMIPPPIPKRLEIKPAAEDPTYSKPFENNFPLFAKPGRSSLRDFLNNRYKLIVINKMAKYNLNSSGSRVEEIKAPITEKGTAKAATLIPMLYLIFFLIE
jgi:hypothetical protein